MPVYTFQCPVCHATREEVQSMKDFAPPICCKEKKMETVIQNVGVIFKGGDWPGQEFKRAGQDDQLRSASRRAKELKTSGAVPMDEVLTFKDVENFNPG